MYKVRIDLIETNYLGSGLNSDVCTGNKMLYEDSSIGEEIWVPKTCVE